MIKNRSLRVYVYSVLAALICLCTSTTQPDPSSPEQAYSVIMLSSDAMRIADSVVIDSVGKPIHATIAMNAGIFIDSIRIDILYGSEVPEEAVLDSSIMYRFGENDLRDTLSFDLVFENPGIRIFKVTTYKKLDYISSVTAIALILGQSKSNSPPEFEDGAPEVVYRFKEDTLIRIPVSATDYNRDPLRYYYRFGDIPLPREETARLENGFFTWKSEPGDSAVYPIIFTVADPYTTVTIKTTLVIGDVDFNSPPRIKTIAPESVEPGFPYKYTPLAEDAEGGTLTWSLSGKHPDGLVFNEANGSLVWLPTAGVVSSGKLLLIVTDDGKPAASDTQEIQIRVKGINRAPVAYTRSVATALDTKVTIVFFAIDPDGDPLTYTLVKNARFGVTEWLNDSTIIYTPGTGYKGVDTLRFFASDASKNSDTVKVLVLIAQENQRPEVLSQQVVVNEDQKVNITLSGRDVEKDALTYHVLEEPRSGTLTGVDSQRVYTPNFNFVGTDTFTYIANDGKLESDQAYVFINVTPVNDSPVVHNIGMPAIKGEPVIIQLSVTDPDDSVFTYSLVTPPTHGSTQNAGALSLEYTPEEGFSGNDTIEYRVADSKGIESNVAKIILVFGGNDVKPVADSLAVSLLEDSAMVITLNGNDPEGRSLTYTVITEPSNGEYVQSGASLLYRPNPNFNGTDGVWYIVNDGLLDSDPAQVVITVNPVNDLPVPISKTYSTSVNTPCQVALEASDLDNETVFTYIITQGPTAGSLDTSLLRQGMVRYMPGSENRSGDTIRYRAKDGSGAISNKEATVIITILAINERPKALARYYEYSEDAGMQQIFLEGEDELPNNLEFGLEEAPLHGWYEFGKKSISYKPDPNYNGYDEFWFTAYDGQLRSEPAKVTIKINPVNDAPRIVAVRKTTELSQMVEFTLNASDPDGETNFIFVIKDGPFNGTVDTSSLESGIVRYTPKAEWKGIDYMIYQAVDGQGWYSNEDSIVISVAMDNQAPEALPAEFEVNEDDSVEITLTGKDMETAVGQLNYVITDFPGHGKLGDLSGRKVWYRPVHNFYGVDQIRFTVSDNVYTSAKATVTIKVNSVNDTPVVISQFVVTDLELARNITLSATDPDGSTGLVFEITGMPDHGVVDTSLMHSDKKIVYTPNEGFKGDDTIFFVAKDPQGLKSSEGHIAISVASGNVPPRADSKMDTTLEETSLEVILSGEDIEKSPLIFTVDSSSKFPKHGSLTGDTEVRTYLPVDDFNGNDTIYYHANDGELNGPMATIIITVTPVNDEPEARDTTYDNLSEDVSVDLDLPCSDVDGDPLTMALASVPSHGEIEMLGGTICRFVPDTDFWGSDSFSYKVSDGGGYTNIAQVNLVIASVNDTPVAVPPESPVGTSEEVAVLMQLSGTDADGDGVELIVPDRAEYGQLTVDGMNVTYDPDEDFAGRDSFFFTVSDGTLESVPAKVIIEVTEVNDPPEINQIPPRTRSQGEPFSQVSLDGYVDDPDNTPDEISWSATSNNEDVLTAEVSDGRALIVTVLSSDWTGTAEVLLTAKDPFDAEATGTVSYTVTENNPPAVSSIEDAVVNVNMVLEAVPFTVGDADGSPDELVITAYSNNVSVIPDDSLEVGGSGTERIIRIAPLTDVNGSALITVKVSDGISADSTQFSVLVNSRPEVNNIESTVFVKDSITILPEHIGSDVEDGTIKSFLFKISSAEEWAEEIVTPYGKVKVVEDSIRYIQSDELIIDFADVPAPVDVIEYKGVDSQGSESEPKRITITISEVIPLDPDIDETQ